MKKIILFASALALHTAVQAQNLLTPEILWGIARISETTVSPKGDQVLFTVTRYDMEANKGLRDLWIKDVKDIDGAPVQITSTAFNEYNAVWRPDGKKIGYLAADAEGAMQLWEMNPDGSGAVQVTSVKDGISNFEYAPDMKHISFTIDVKLEPTVQDIYPDLPKANARIIDGLMYRHWNAWSDYAYSHVCYMNYSDGAVSGDVVDILKNEKFDAPLQPFGGAEQITWTPDGKSIAYTSKKVSGRQAAVSTNSDIYLYDLAAGKTSNLTEGMPGYDQEPAFSPDGKTMIWLSMLRDGYEADRNRIFSLDLATGKKEELTQGFDNNAGNLSWSADGKKIYFISGIRATEQMYEMDVKTKSIRKITDGKHNYLTMEAAGKWFIGERQSMSAPTDIYRVDPATGMADNITLLNTAYLSRIKMGEVKERTVKTTDGKDMLVWVIYPPDFDPTKKYPTLLYCQGGPQSTVSQFFSYRWNMQLMAANGYIVVAPNRRGLPSFGQAWNEQISGDWGGQPMRDYLSAIDDVCKETYVNRDRLGAVGASYGGYSVYYLAGIHEKRFKTFIAHCGLFNLESWYGSTEELFFANFDLKGPYWNSPPPPSYERFSPHKFVKNWDTPMLVIHGEKDFRVPVTEGMQAFQAAQIKGIPSRFLYFPEEGHWIMQPQNSILWQREFFGWLDRWLKESK